MNSILNTSFSDTSRYGIEYDPVFRRNVIEHIFPGNCYQYYIAHKNKSFLRSSPQYEMLTNGWNLYIRELIYNRGMFGGDFELLADFYNDLRSYALATIIEIGIHTGRFNFESAYAYVDSMLGSEDAREYSQTNFCTCVWPMENLSYMLGRLLILDMKENARARDGDSFSLSEFHAKLLSEGNIPLSLIAWKYGWQ